jgi:hypothetical protein
LAFGHCEPAGGQTHIAKLKGVGATIKGRKAVGGRGIWTNKPALIARPGWGVALIACGIVFVAPASAQAPASAGTFTMEQVISYPFVPELDAAEKGDAIAFVRVLKGVRNVWVADGPAFKPR